MGSNHDILTVNNQSQSIKQVVIHMGIFISNEKTFKPASNSQERKKVIKWKGHLKQFWTEDKISVCRYPSFLYSLCIFLNF